MRIWLSAVILLGLSLGLAPSLQAGTSCTTRYDPAFNVYRTRCTDGRQFKSKYDRGFDRYRTQELPPWKKVEPKGRRR